MRFGPIATAWLCLVFGGGIVSGENSDVPALTNVLQLLHLPGLNVPTSYSVRLAGMVLWADADTGRMALQDTTGAAVLDMDWQGQPVQAGRGLRITGEGTVTQTGGSFRLGIHGAVVDNNGVHTMKEKSGSAFLEAGRHPIRLDWFNDTDESGLEVEYSGPALARQIIPDSALFRPVTNALDGSHAFQNGLEYECYVVPGEILPEDEPSIRLKSGVTARFDISVRSREEHVGLSFRGYLEVPQDGLYAFYTRSDDGSRLFIDDQTLQILVTGKQAFPIPRELILGQPVDKECQWAQATGKVTFGSEQGGKMELEIRSGTGSMLLEIADAAGLSTGNLMGHRVRATGVCLCASTADGQRIAGTMLVANAANLVRLDTNPVEPAGTSGITNGLPVLTTAAEVHRLKREEAQLGYPVQVRGVVTCVLPDHEAFTIQDDTRGLYAVDFTTNRARLPEIGDYLEVKGTTDPGLFAPVVNASELDDLGPGHLPDPVRPTWDQLLNGSLDAQYVEVQGIITAVTTNGVTMLMREGRINLELRVPGLTPAALENFENALVRVRGCLFANWDYVTHEVKAGEVRIYGASLSVDQPAPADLFATPAKTVGELLLFDPQAGMLQRVKVAGQILGGRDTEFFMTDGHKGLRFIATKPTDLSAGDRVEVVGFPDVSGISPVLREAVARKTGQGPLPEPKVLSKDELIQAEQDSTRVQVKGVLVSVREMPTDEALEMQNGVRSFIARVPGGHNLTEALPVGCELELTGVYSGQGGNKAVGEEITAFELLLNNSSDIKVLARPPWLNLERMLVLAGALGCVLAVTVLWITQLHRKVEARTAELEIQIKARQRVEQQREMAHERARVAQDLHDELGSSLTEISMLAARARSAAANDERRANYLGQMSDKAREIVAALDEIVWAMNPRHDSLASLVSYFSLYADRFLGLANIPWRLEDESIPADFAVDSRYRHQLFLAFKEALTNVVRHSGATEVRLRIGLEEGEVRLRVTDNGCGLPASRHTENMDGVANMRARAEKLGGRFELGSTAGHGTTLLFCIPANKIL